MFRLLKIENARMNVPEPEYLEVTDGEAVAEGEALVLASGKLTKCGATAAPAYIAMGVKTAADTKRTIPVCRVEKNQVYAVPVTAAPASVKIGDKVTLHTDGLRVTATTTNGVVTVVDLNGASVAGDEIIVRI